MQIESLAPSMLDLCLCSRHIPIYIDRGNGEGGASWSEWNEDVDEKYGDIEMYDVDSSERAYEDGDDIEDTLLGVAMTVVPTYPEETTEMCVSKWIEDDDRGGEFEPVNPYRFRIIF